MFDAFVTFQARLQPRALAIIAPGRTATYAELEADVNRFALGLRGLGVTPASGVVSIQLANTYLAHVALLALARLGVSSSPAGDPAADLRLNDRLGAQADNLLPLSAGWIAATLEAEPLPVAPVRGDLDAVGRVMLSSGTTRQPRRLAQSWRMVDANARNALATYTAGRMGRWVAFTGMDTMIGQSMTLSAWAVGATVVVDMAIEELADQLDILEPTIIGMTPAQLRGLLRSLPAGFAIRPGLRVMTGGSGLPAAVAREARLRLSPDVCIGYGATECGVIAFADAALLDTIPGVAGYAVPDMRVEVVDGDGVPVESGEQGEIRIRSPRAARAYIGDPEASARVFRDGALYPGDLGRLMPDGLLVIDGRVDERMIVGSRKILPGVIEDVALTCPGVIDAAAFAAPDAQGIDQCWLAVVRGEGFTRETLVALLRAQGPALPPVRFAWSDEIPRNAMGKVERARLREGATSVLAAGETPR
jgi:acyl-coenzyme A synthetase/AMP-(fatty) acid ligase